MMGYILGFVFTLVNGLQLIVNWEESVNYLIAMNASGTTIGVMMVIMAFMNRD